MQPIARAHNFGTYFITANCAQRRRVFQVDRNAELLFHILQRNRTHYKLHAFVIMPDHLHLILTPVEITLERAMQLIKGGFSREYNAERPLKMTPWQRGFADHRIRNREEFERYRTYIEQNPVVRGVVERAEDYQWSSCSSTLRKIGSLSG